MMDLMSMRSARGRDHDEEKQESETEQAHEAPSRGGTQFTSSGAIPPVGSLAPVASGPSASDRAFGDHPSIQTTVGLDSTIKSRGAPVVEDEGLEHEADEMGSKAVKH
jgi:hypothetical protein